MTAPFSSSASALRAELFKVVICILIGCAVFGLTRRVFATCADGLDAYYTSVGAQNACESAKDGRAGCYYNSSGSLYWAYRPNPARDYIFFYICSCPNNKCCAERDALELQCGGGDKYTIDENTCQGSCNSTGDPCAADREILESECGERGYVIDEDTCEGSCINCPDSDDDGVGDACDFCPDNPNYGRKEIKKYIVPGLTICGTYLYAGESCGYSIVQCDRSEEYHPISPQIIDAREMARCCRAKVEEEECVVDENCNANKDEGVCECPDGSTNCDTCQDGKCTCPDLDGDGSPDSPCQECQLPEDKCTCPDTDFDGEPNSPCNECQDEDGDGEPDGDPGPQPPPPDPSDQDGDKIPDNEDPCPKNPNPNCQPGDEDGDKIPDDKDPCPKNPDPNCTTTCLTTLDKFKAWTMTAESFPFNWMRAVSNIFGPLTSLSPALPESLGGSMTVEISSTVTGQTTTFDFGNGYKIIRESIVIARLSLAVKVLRWGMGITILMYMLPYFVARWSNIHGVSR